MSPKGIAKTVAIIGCGKVGQNWALLFLRAGWSVRVFDPDPAADQRLREVVAHVRSNISEYADVSEVALSFHDTLSDVVQGAVWIQESAPDRIGLKRSIYQKVQAHSSPNTLIASSSETLTTNDVHACAPRAKYIMVIRPLSTDFNTEHVAIFEGQSTSRSLLIQTSEFLKTLGLKPEIQPS